MADIFSKEKRSEVMRLVKGKNTKPEVLLRQKLHSLGYRFRLHDKSLPGSPDIKLAKYKTVIFINGCFWHGHQGCKHYTVPKTNRDFWVNKIETNTTNDKLIYEKLSSLGWKVLIIWTCELKKKNLETVINKVNLDLKNHAHK